MKISVLEQIRSQLEQTLDKLDRSLRNQQSAELANAKAIVEGLLFQVGAAVQDEEQERLARESHEAHGSAEEWDDVEDFPGF